MSDLQYWTACILDGAANGVIYGLLALSLVVMFRTNKLFNFSQTSVITFLMIVTTGFVGRVPTPALFIGALIAGLLTGLFLHFGVMRFITENKRATPLSQIVAIFALMAIFDGLASLIFGDIPQSFPFLFPDGAFNVGGFNFSYNSLGIIGSAFFLLFLIWMFFSFTGLGLTMEAVAENVSAARLRGIRASNVLMVSWGVTGIMGVAAGLLIAPIVFVSPGMLGPVFGYSLFAVVIGGLESPLGAVIGGIVIGIIENIAGNIEWLGAELKFSVVFMFLIIVLSLMPRGIFGRADYRRV